MPENFNKQIKKLFIYSLIASGLSIAFFDYPAAHLLTQGQALQAYRTVRTLTDAGEGGHFFAIAILGSLIPWLLLKRREKFSAVALVRLQKVKDWSLSFLISLCASGVIVHICKFLIGRQRPHVSEEYDPWVFDPVTANWHFHSLPSGHSQTLFAVAAALAFTFPKHQIWIYILIFCLSFTRVILHQHFLSDVFMGAFIGYAVTTWIYYKRAKAPALS